MIKLCALMRAKQRDEAHETSLPYNIIVIDGNAIDRVRQAKVLGVTVPTCAFQLKSTDYYEGEKACFYHMPTSGPRGGAWCS